MIPIDILHTQLQKRSGKPAHDLPGMLTPQVIARDAYSSDDCPECLLSDDLPDLLTPQAVQPEICPTDSVWLPAKRSSSDNRPSLPSAK